jgi:hypothetical protein
MVHNYYTKPTLRECYVSAEKGFANSYNAGTAGGDIDYKDYGEEL